MKIRVGFGYDVHAFVADRELWLEDSNRTFNGVARA